MCLYTYSEDALYYLEFRFITPETVESLGYHLHIKTEHFLVTFCVAKAMNTIKLRIVMLINMSFRASLISKRCFSAMNYPS